jgi:hypothetical protein
MRLWLSRIASQKLAGHLLAVDAALRLSFSVQIIPFGGHRICVRPYILDIDLPYAVF